jgi:hypothetical protein
MSVAGKPATHNINQEKPMKPILNVVIVGVLAAAPLAIAHPEQAKGNGGGCQGMRSSTEGMQGRHAGHHARMAAMHQGMQSEGRDHRHGQAESQEKSK